MKNDKLIPDSPSPLEEEFQYEFTELIDQYKKDFLTHGWSAEELAKWCKEMVDKELRESEDERIRKALVWHLKADVDFVSNGVTKAECIAYLEKQKEQKPAEWNANDKAFIKDCARILDENGYEASAERLLSMFPVKPTEWNEEDVKRLYSIGTEIGFLKGKYSEWQKDIDWLYTLAEKMGFHKCKIGEVVTEWKKEDIDDKMLSKSKPSWSEEDEKNCNRIIRFLEPHKTFFPTKETKEEMQNWLKNRLKSLRPQPQREWSEEDETMINHIIEALPKWANGLITILPSQAEEYVKRLKSLRPQYHGDVTMTEAYKMGLEAGRASSWRPSEEQIYSLGTVVKGVGEANVGSIGYNLKDLYEQLKKL